MLLAFDLDKTIVTERYELREDVTAAIAAARQAGHQVTVLTGRTHASALPFLQRLGVHGLYSVNHGAQVYGADGALVRQVTIPEPHVRALLARYGKRLDLETSCVIGNTLYARHPEDPRWAWAHTVDQQQLLPLDRYPGGAADKVVFSVPNDGEVLHGEISTRFPELVLYLWEDHFLEVTGAQAHKGAALALIATMLGIPQRDTVAFGDGVNDVSMLSWAGYAVAVGAAHPEALAAADERVASPEQGGVVQWLKANVL